MDLQALKKFTLQDNVSLCVFKSTQSLTFEGTGLKPLVLAISSHPQLFEDGAVKDKVVGKAAALLLCYAKVKTVYSSLGSREAAKIFDEFKVEYEFDKTVDFILNRDGTAACPMEQRAMDITSPKIAYDIFNQLILSKTLTKDK